MSAADTTNGDARFADVEAFIEANQSKSLLRFITCGSVDDGKSTLIGRLLYDAQLVFEDHLAALERDSEKVGTQGGDLDFALLLDGLSAEREQGITIDVAYRFFATDRRKFIVADTPGHEQYTRNMVTGASTADAAVILVDARNGVVTQTRRHAYVASLLGVRHIVVAINKMDLVDYSRDVFDSIRRDFTDVLEHLDHGGDATATYVPLSALHGDNVTVASDNMGWYDGPTLMEFLETVEVADDLDSQPFRMPVQWVNRPNLDFRGFSGQIVGGTLRPGDAIVALPEAAQATVKRIVTYDGDLDVAVSGQSVTVVLDDEVDVSRGDILVAADERPEVLDQFEAHVVWMDEAAMLPGRRYLMKIGTRTVGVSLSAPKYRVDVNSFEQHAADTLELNDIGVCNLSLDRPVPFDPYPGLARGERNAGQPGNRNTGGFIVIDRFTQNTVAAGMLHFGLRRARNIHRQQVAVDKDARIAQQGHGAGVVWFTGLSGAGKSTVADRVEQLLHAEGVRTYLLDGDNVRHGLNRDLGFTDADRVENIRRVAEVAALMADAGIVVLVSFISPFRAERSMARELIGDEEFIEAYVDVPLDVAESRDPKGLYAKARRGEIKNFTGLDSPYEPPESPELHLETDAMSVDDAARAVVAALRANGTVP